LKVERENIMNGADSVVTYLRSRGIEFITTVCGNGLEPLYEACARAGIRLVDFRNEQAASLAADTVARLTGKLAVCMVSSGGAHVNALAGLTNAHYDEAPVLLITGASEHSRTDMGKFQELEQVALARPICKYARLVDRTETLVYHVREACVQALSPGGGPVHLTIPRDVLTANVDNKTPLVNVADTDPINGVMPSSEAVEEAAGLFTWAERPVMIVGSGAFRGGAGEAVEEFASQTKIPTLVPIWDRGVVAKGSDTFAGVVGADSGGPRILPDADLVIMVGARVDYRIGYAQSPAMNPKARLVRIDVDENRINQGRDPHVGIAADIGLALKTLRENLSRRGFDPHIEWLEEAKRRYVEFQDGLLGHTEPSTHMTGRHIVEHLKPHLTHEAVFLIDGGNIGQWVHVLADSYPDNWLTCGPSGVVGWGVAGAIGAKLVNPDRPVILLTGDGAIGFGLMEFETAVRHNTPFVAVLADDQAWGIVVSGQMRSRGPNGDIASRLGPVDYPHVVDALGGKGVSIVNPEDIGAALQNGLTAGRPTLIHVPIAVEGPKG
jgi:acetolactate synthase-1/2/3 large subunit